MSDLTEGAEQGTVGLTAVQTAKARIEEFTRKIATFDDRARVNRETRAACDPNDKKTLAQLHDEALKIGLQIEDARAWVEIARKELAAAERAEVQAETRAKAARLSAIGVEIMEFSAVLMRTRRRRMSNRFGA
jgi:hypothetical protein